MRRLEGQLPGREAEGQLTLTLLNALIKAKPQAAKGRYLKKISLSSSMGPSVMVDTIATQKSAERI
jgi:large subunit ribosomal protein L1